MRDQNVIAKERCENYLYCHGWRYKDFLSLANGIWVNKNYLKFEFSFLYNEGVIHVSGDEGIIASLPVNYGILVEYMINFNQIKN